MNIKKTGTTFVITIEGSIGEGSPLFGYDMRDATCVRINGEKMTYINSIGVKNWISWTLKLPSRCELILANVPLVMINQAATVSGFLPRHARIESFQAPYVCPACGAEKMISLNLGTDYEYGKAGRLKVVKLPVLACPKCKAIMDPDFLESKTFTFLNENR